MPNLCSIGRSLVDPSEAGGKALGTCLFFQGIWSGEAGLVQWRGTRYAVGTRYAQGITGLQ